MAPKRINSGNKQTCTEKCGRRIWSSDEIIQILEFMKSTIEVGDKIEKPNARAYYSKMVEQLDLRNCNSISVINKISNLKKAYGRAIEWRSETGQGVDEGTVNDKMKELCPYFDDLDEIYSERASDIPPYKIETDSTAGSDSDNADSQNDFDSPENCQPSNTSVLYDGDTTSPPQSPDEIPKRRKLSSKQQTAKSSEYAVIVRKRQELQLRQEEMAIESRRIDLDLDRLKVEQDIQNEKLLLDKKRLEFEMSARNDEFDFKRDQLRFEKEKSEREYELEKFRIEQNVKLQIELAKIGHHTTVIQTQTSTDFADLVAIYCKITEPFFAL